MQKVGKQVLFLPTEEKNPRNGEGSFIRLKDGKIMFVYTQYYGDDWNDHAIARLAYVCSEDEGESWSSPRCLIEKDETALNIMSVSLIRLQNGEIGILYLQKEAGDDGVVCMPIFRYSQDECKTWSAPIACSKEYGYFVGNNDRLIQLKNGRLLMPLSYHGKSLQILTPGMIRFVYSDDNGRSWTLTDVKIRSSYSDDRQCQEPGVFELDDGRLWTYFRTAYGHQYQSFSLNDGETWSAPIPNLYFTSPDSPMLVKRVKDYVIAIFNPIGYHCLNTRTEAWRSPKRTPYVCAVSRDGGVRFDSTDKSFADGGFAPFIKNCVLLEDDLKNSYCYPAVLETKEGFLVAYYHSNDTEICLNSTKIIKITHEEMENALL